jgi:uncharacterized repeat protein (TIGR03803 family)
MKTRFLLIIAITVFGVINATAQVPELWGTTSRGGVSNIGTIFKTDTNGTNHSVEHDFYRNAGYNPEFTYLCEVSGKLYGMTCYGGFYDKGVIFEYDPVNDTYISKVDFDDNNGANPFGGLLLASNGKLYGMTLEGGTNNEGVLFEYDITLDTIIKKIDFDGSNNGGYPFGSLMQATNGKLYGMTNTGGANGEGVIFEYDIILDTLIKKLDFNTLTDGGEPLGDLMQASNGKLYGMTYLGGAYDAGILFEYDIALDTIMIKWDFDGNTGSDPFGTLMQATNGKLYGTATYGGAGGYGSFFEYDIALDTLIKKFDFDDTNTGSEPYGFLIQATNGKLYGTTSWGGTSGDGVLYEYNIATDTCINKYNFNGDNGAGPEASLLQASNGKLYGVTCYGGVNGEDEGVLFEYNIVTDTLIKKLDFNYAANGERLRSKIMQASNGKMYGTTYTGGKNDDGVLFEYNPLTNTVVNKLDFDDAVYGRLSESPLLQATNGKLYGVTPMGGANGYGTFFEYDIITDTCIVLLDFNNTNGSSPSGLLIQATNGKLYGTTGSGGTSGDGVLFEYDITTNMYVKKIDFDNTNKGAFPKNIMQASNGKLYGMTQFGGINNKGVLFEYNLTTTIFTKKLDFDGANNGRSSTAILIEAITGKLYGLTRAGGTNDKGVLFEYDFVTDTYTKKWDFDGTNDGSNLNGSLMKSSNGKLYGMAARGGAYDEGVLFEYDLVTDTLIKKMDFDNTNGGAPLFSQLIEVNICYPTYNTISENACDTYTSPSGNFMWTISGVYNDTLVAINPCGGDSIITINLTINNVDTSVTQTGVLLTSNATAAAYQWLDCNNTYSPIPGETNQSFTALTNGSYAVEVTENTCTDTSACYTVIGVNIEKPDFNQTILLYPNPSKGNITIEGLNMKRIEVYDCNAQKIKDISIENDIFNIDLSKNSKGIYFVKVTTEQAVLVEKIILK